MAGLTETVTISVILTCALICGIMAVSLSPADRRLYDDLKSGRGLYNSDDKVTVLNAKNFKNSVYGTKNAWIVEFYNSWCGFCHRFAPVWKTLASDIYDWRDVVTVAAVDCANDDNNPLCREYEIMLYPMLKFFPANSKPDQMGIAVNKGKNADEIRYTLVELLEKEHMAGRGVDWPNITPYRNSDIKNLWKNVPKSVLFYILIFEDSESFIGTEVILDLHQIKSIELRSVLNQNEAVSKLMGVSSYPTIVVVERDMTTIPLSVGDNTRESFRKVIKDFLKSRRVIVPEEEQSKAPVVANNMEISELLSIIATEEEQEKKKHNNQQIGDIVFQVDLDKAVSYSLKHEVPSYKLISGDAFIALNNYLNVLVKYLPISNKGHKVLENLRNAVIEHKNEVTRESVLEYLNRFDPDESAFSNNNWIGCRGSKPQYRGYPCGLWTLFHTMSVNALLQNPEMEPLEVLNAMLGYITYFFGCQDCSKHFQEMAARSMNIGINSPRDSVLWLWKAHNEANKRLSGDASEDPEHIKIQFPSRNTCPQCRNKDDEWNTEEVLNYLKDIYGKHNISQKGIDTSQKKDSNQSNKENMIVERFIDVEKRKMFGWNFNVFDISLCVVLYAFSATILILVCIKFVMRRGYRKKAYVHDILGKV
ncbi:hypothetical protein C0J52_25442 [Blattella germanica]|nr:hypothetical protein C0J52_25442 [Blattella germanica]